MTPQIQNILDDTTKFDVNLAFTVMCSEYDERLATQLNEMPIRDELLIGGINQYMYIIATRAEDAIAVKLKASVTQPVSLIGILKQNVPKQVLRMHEVLVFTNGTMCKRHDKSDDNAHVTYAGIAVPETGCTPGAKYGKKVLLYSVDMSYDNYIQYLQSNVRTEHKNWCVLHS